MLAMRIERDVADEHEVVVGADLRERALEHVGRAFAVAAEQLLVGVDDARRRVEQALAIGIVAGKGDQRAHGRDGLVPRGARHRRLGRGAHVLRQASLGKRLYDGIHDGLSVRPGNVPGVSPVAASLFARPLRRQEDAALYLAETRAECPEATWAPRASRSTARAPIYSVVASGQTPRRSNSGYQPSCS